MAVSLIRTFLSTTSFHGLKFLGADRLHWTERLFWTVCCAFSWLASVVLMNSAWYSFQNNAISFVVETNFLDWETEFPSVSVCEIDNQKRMTQFTDKLFGDPHDYNLDEVVKEAAFFKGLFFFTLEICGPESPRDPNCFRKSFSDYANELKSSCGELFNKCSWNDVEFDCCRHFKELRTDLGYCYAINNLQNRDGDPYRMVSNKKTGPGTLRLEINGTSNVYVLGEQEIPSLQTSPADTLQLSPNTRFRRYFTVKDIENQPEVKDLSISQRKCRFPDENYLEVVPYYSYSGCLLQCKKNAQTEKCGCAHHLVPNTPVEKRCNITGLSCLNEHYREVTVLKPAWSDRVGLVCECLPSCTETQLNVVRDYKERYKRRELERYQGRSHTIFRRSPRFHQPQFPRGPINIQRHPDPPVQRFLANSQVFGRTPVAGPSISQDKQTPVSVSTRNTSSHLRNTHPTNNHFQNFGQGRNFISEELFNTEHFDDQTMNPTTTIKPRNKLKIFTKVRI